MNQKAMRNLPLRMSAFRLFEIFKKHVMHYFVIIVVCLIVQEDHLVRLK